MKLNLAALLQICFPYSQDEQCITACTKDSFNSKLFVQHGPHGKALASFKDREVRAAVHLVKFHNNKHAAALLGSLLSAYLKTLPREPVILIPMPLSPARLRARGHNQVATVASIACAGLPHVIVRTDLLARVRHTPSQTSLSGQHRRTNLSGAFAVAEKRMHEIRNTHIILCDDVITTGSTMREAKHTLAAGAPASIECIGLAH